MKYVFFFQVAGPYLPQYEIYYNKLDPEGKNEIAAMDAAGFLKKSGLSDEMLGKIWDLSDPNGKGFLDKAGMFVACKMVALVQSDTPLTIDNARFQCPAPNFGADTAPGAPVAKVAPKQGGNVNFLVKPEEKRKYDALFDQLQPQEEKLPGDKVNLCDIAVVCIFYIGQKTLKGPVEFVKYFYYLQR